MPPSEQERALSSEPTRPPEKSSSERRRTPRAKPAGLSYVKLEPDNGGRLLDVCESGIGFQVVAPVEETGKIQLWFVLDSASHIEVSGELAWIDDTKRSGGLKFTRPSKQARQQLRAWLSHQRTGPANEQPLSPAASIPSSAQAPPSPATQIQPRLDELSHECQFERELHSLPHTDPAPLESLLDTILASIQTSPPEDLFARPAALVGEGALALPHFGPAAPPEIEASGLVEKMAQEHTASMPSIAPAPPSSASAKAPVRASAPAAISARPAARPRAPRRNPVPRSTPAAQTSDAIARAVGFNSSKTARPEKSSDVKYAQFRIAVDRVSGMLNTIRHAISADDSDWPLTAIPEYDSALAAAPVEVPQAAPPLAAPAPPVAAAVALPVPVPVTADVAPAIASVVEPIEVAVPVLSAPEIAEVAPAHVAELVAEPKAPAVLDVRPWSAGAPWKAAEVPAASANWFTTLPSRIHGLVEAALKGTASRILRAHDAFAPAWSKFTRNARVASAGIFAKTASLARAAKTGIAPTLSRTGSATVAAAITSARGISTATAALLMNLKPAPRSASSTANAAAALTPRAAQPVITTTPVATAPILTTAPVTSPTPAQIAPTARPTQPAPAPPIASAAQSTPAFTVLQSSTTALDASREKLAAASNEIKRASSKALFKLIPREPTLGEMGAMLAITVVLIVGLVTFNYRDKLSSFMDSFGSDDTALARPSTSPESTATTKKSKGHVLKTRRNGATEAAIGNDAGREAMPQPSTREMATALAYLKNDSRGQRDATTAAQWLWAATRKGDTGANIVLADLYVRGDGVAQNCAQARVLLLAASKKGNEKATQNLQQLDAKGCGEATQ